MTHQGTEERTSYRVKMTSVEADTTQSWEFAVFCHWCSLISTRGLSPSQLVPGAMAPEWSFQRVFKQLRKCEYKYIKPDWRAGRQRMCALIPELSHSSHMALGKSGSLLILSVSLSDNTRPKMWSLFLWDVNLPTSFSSLRVIWSSLGIDSVTC